MPASADSSASAAAFAERDGLLWIAFGERYVSEAEHSAGSAAPMLARALLADREPATGVFDVVRRIEPGHIRAKVDFLAESPFARTLYLDSDTRVVGELADVFELLACCCTRARMAKPARSGAEPALLEPRILHWHGLDRKPRFWSRLSPKYRPYRY